MADNLICIDATQGKFTQKRWAEFCSYIKDENEIIHFLISSDNDIEDRDFAYCDKRKLFESEDFVNLVKRFKNNVAAFVCDDAELDVDVNDVEWWLKNKDGVFIRLDKLFNDVNINCANKPKVKAEKSEKKERSSSKKMIKIAAGILNDNSIDELELFEGDDKDAVVFINKYYMTNTIRKGFENNTDIRFVIDYKEDEELYNIDNWKTIAQLDIEGVIKTE